MYPQAPWAVVSGTKPPSRSLPIRSTRPQSPGDVYSLDVATGKTQRWTTAWAPAGIDLNSFASPELVQIKSFDGLPISAWLFLPDAKKFPGKRPVLVGFHGGPEGQSTVRFMGRTNYYLNEMGIAVLLPNVRGSSGYGKTLPGPGQRLQPQGLRQGRRLPS